MLSTQHKDDTNIIDTNDIRVSCEYKFWVSVLILYLIFEKNVCLTRFQKLSQAIMLT